MSPSSASTNESLKLGISDADFASASLDLLDNHEASSHELAFSVGDSINSISFCLDPASLAVEDQTGTIHQANFDGTDATVAALAGSIPGLTIDPEQAQLPWSAQSVVAGTPGSDQISVANTSQSSWLIGTTGNDRLAGSSALLNGVDYASDTFQDHTSGLFITNDPSQTTIVENNLPPLVADAFSADDLLVFKRESASVDQLNEIEVIKATSVDD